MPFPRKVCLSRALCWLKYDISVAPIYEVKTFINIRKTIKNVCISKKYNAPRICRKQLSFLSQCSVFGVASRV